VRFVSKLLARQSSPIVRVPLLHRHLMEFGLCYQGSGNDGTPSCVCPVTAGPSLVPAHRLMLLQSATDSEEPTAGLGVPLCRYDGGSSWSASYQGEGLACSGE
jgi:hypothetical protein